MALAGRRATDRHLLFLRVRLRQGSANCTSGRAANDRRRSRPELLKERRKATIRMPTIISHGVSALAIGNVFPHGRVPLRFWILSIFCAMLPDIDVVGFAFGFKYEDMLGHRGLTHSFAFALFVGCIAGLITWSREKRRWFPFILYFFLVTASHGILDAMTNGGLGVAFFAPFSNARYFFPWRPIEVSPLGLDRFLSSRGIEVMVSEIKWVWIPSGLVVLTAYFLRRVFSANHK